MNDTDIIQSGYADALTRLFSVYFDALATGGGDTSAETQAASEFKAGVALARRARDQAVAFVTRGSSG
ncbi:MAG: hypothetical protein ABI379_10605 [Rhodanobacter sp.]